MSHHNPLSHSLYEIVKYNVTTRKDMEVLPGQVEGLGEVNRQIRILNASIEADKNNRGGEFIYYRRRVSGK